MFMASRVFKWFGVHMAFFVLPIVAMGVYGLVSVATQPPRSPERRS